MVAPHPLPAELAKRPFTVAEAAALGVPAAALRGARLRAPFRGVRVPGALPDDLDTDAAALALLLDGGWAFSHATAARMTGLPVPKRLERRRPLHVEVDDVTPVPQVAGVVGHEGLDRDRVVQLPRSGLPVVHPARTWCDLVPVLGDEDAVVLGDAVVRRWGGLALLGEVLASRDCARGVVRMRKLWPLLRERVDSPQETRTRLVLLRAGLPEPECGLPVYDAGGGWLATPDLSWPAVKVAIEYDGDVHRKKRRQWLNDIGRNENMADHGWRVLVVTADDLRRPWVLVQRVSTALRSRGLTW